MQYEVLAEKLTKVVWSMQGDMNMPIIDGYLVLIMASKIGTMFERGLSKLTSQIEQGGGTTVGYKNVTPALGHCHRHLGIQEQNCTPVFRARRKVISLQTNIYQTAMAHGRV